MKIIQNNTLLTENGVLADRFFTRFMGLMGKSTLDGDFCLILTPCSAIHMAFMRLPLDVAYLGADQRVIGIQHGVMPWTVGGYYKGTVSVLEAPVGGVVRRLSLGDSVSWNPVA